MVEINYFFLKKYMGLTFFGQHTTIWSPDSDRSRAPTQRDLSRVIFVRGKKMEAFVFLPLLYSAIVIIPSFPLIL
jgi:hypothetical protein